MAAKRKTIRAKKPAKASGVGPPPWELWRRYWKVAALVAGLVLGGWWVSHMELVFVRKERIKEITSKPATALWFQQQRLLVEADGGPDALWFGEIGDIILSHPVDSSAQPRLVKVVFQEGVLLVGDGDAVIKNLPIYVYGHRFDGAEPNAGERWVVSTHLDEEGNRKIHAGLPFE